MNIRPHLRFLATLFCLAAPVLSWAQVNLLSNGSFERRTSGGLPDAWTNVYGGNLAVVSNITTKCGDNVLRLVDGSVSTSAGLFSDPLNVIPGEAYTVEAYIQRTDTNLNGASIYIKYFDASGTNQVGTFSVVSSSAANVWGYVSVTGAAPTTAESARVLCYSTSLSTGTMYFDGVSFRHATLVPPANQLIEYVSPAGAGTSSGLDNSNPAKYNAGVFWGGVRAALATNPVQVVFLEGDYVINNDADRLVLTNIGNAANLLTVKGEHPFGSVFTRNDSAPASAIGIMANFDCVTNAVIRHLHWENDITDPAFADKLVSYCLVINSGASGPASKNVLIEGCSFVGVARNIYGALGIHDKLTHGVKIANCEFIRGGHATGFHMIYNAYGPYDLLFQQNYFQDCAGAYLRLRANCHNATVTSNEFVSTTGAYNQPFVELATFNDVNPGDETWGYNFTLSNNRFAYLATPSSVALNLHHAGFDPVRSPGLVWDYLLTSAEASMLTSGSVTAKKSLLKNNFGLNFDTQVTMGGNTRLGYHAHAINLTSRSQYGSPDYGGDGDYDISDIETPRPAPTTNSWILNANASWDLPANWSPAGVPNGLGALARLTNNLTATCTNTLDAVVTLGVLQIGSLDSAFNFVIESYGGSTLTFDNSGVGAKIISSGTNPLDAIRAPVVLADDLTITNTKTLTISGVIIESGEVRSITKVGVGQLTLGNTTNSFSGGLIIKDGVVNGPSKLGAGPVTLGDTTGTNIATLLGSGTCPNAVTVAAGSTGLKTIRNAGTAAQMTVSGPITLHGNLLANAGNNTLSTTLSGVIDGAGALTTSSATGSTNFVVISGANAFGGGVTLQSGPLRLGNDSALGTGTLTITSGTLASDGGAARTLTNPVVVNGNFILGQTNATGDLTFAGPVDLGTATRTITVINSNCVVLGVISGAGGLVKSGAGTLGLSGVNTYAGGTTNSAGTLLVNGTIGPGATTVKTGGTVGGSGKIRGPVMMESGGRLAPGNATIGTLSVSNTLTLAAGSSTVMELDQANNTSDAIKGITTVTYGGTLTVTNLAGNFSGGESFNLFSAANSQNNFSATNLPALVGSLDWVWNRTNGTLSVVARYATNLSYGVNGNFLTLAWPGSHLGWLAQSNAVNLANSNFWFDIAGSSALTNLNLPRNPAEKNVFYRLHHP